MMKHWIWGACVALGLSACTWETYQTAQGQTALRQKYPTGSGIYYTNGAASQNTHYHHHRPQQHAITPEQ